MLKLVPSYLPTQATPLHVFAHLGGDRDHESCGLGSQLVHGLANFRHLRPQLLEKFHIAYRGADLQVLDTLVENAWRLAVRQNRLRQYIDPHLRHISVIVNLGLYSPDGNSVYLVFGLDRNQLNFLRRDIGHTLGQSNRGFMRFRPTGVRAAVEDANKLAETLRNSPRHRNFILHAVYVHGKDPPLNCCPDALDLPLPPDYSWPAMRLIDNDFTPFFDGPPLHEGMSGREFDVPPCIDPSIDVTPDVLDRCIIFARRNPDYQAPYYSDGVRGTSIFVYADPTLPPIMQPHRTLLIINAKKAFWITDAEAATGSLAITLPRTFSVLFITHALPQSVPSTLPES